MATRSLIGKIKSNKEVELVYCHWDGDPSWTGKLLYEIYNTEEKINQILELGNLSNLDKSIEKPENHNFDNRVEGYSVFFFRDRGEPDNQKVVLFDWQEHFQSSWCEYIYLFDTEKKIWFFADHNLKLRKLSKEIVEEIEEA